MSEATIPVIETPAPQKVYRKRRAVKRTHTPRKAADAARMGVGAQAQDPAQAHEAREDAGPETEELRRVSRQEREVDRFSVPKHRIKPGWDVEWKTTHVVNQAVDSATLREIHDGGWRPEKAKDWPELVLPGTAPDAAVDQFGQRLYGRPKSFTLAAKQEDYDIATRQMRDRAQGAQEGRLSGGGGDGLAQMGKVVRPVPLGISIEGEVGSTGPVHGRR